MFWLTDDKLVAAVSEAGGLGVLGPHAGQNSLPKDDAERAERMRNEIRKVKELTSKPFGINIFHSGQNPDIQLQLMLKVVYEEKVPVAVVAMRARSGRDITARLTTKSYLPFSSSPRR